MLSPPESHSSRAASSSCRYNRLGRAKNKAQRVRRGPAQHRVTLRSSRWAAPAAPSPTAQPFSPPARAAPPPSRASFPPNSIKGKSGNLFMRTLPRGGQSTKEPRTELSPSAPFQIFLASCTAGPSHRSGRL